MAPEPVVRVIYFEAGAKVSNRPEADIENRKICLVANANNIQWKRISAEGAAIVVSILLAFSIEAWCRRLVMPA